MQVAVLLAFLLCNASLAMAASIIDVVDDGGHRISLSVPASRIISLAPNITELLYAAGAGAAAHLTLLLAPPLAAEANVERLLDVRRHLG